MKNLVVVYDKKTKQYANYLSQLIMQNDDTEDAVVGIKDGDVDIRALSEEEFKASSASIAASQYILFIGNGKVAKEYRKHMNIQFKRYGMRYAWLGHQSALYIDHLVHSKDYEEFLNFARRYQGDVRNVKDYLSKAVRTFKERKQITDQQYCCLLLKFYMDGINKFLNQ